MGSLPFLGVGWDHYKTTHGHVELRLGLSNLIAKRFADQSATRAARAGRHFEGANWKSRPELGLGRRVWKTTT